MILAAWLLLAGCLLVLGWTYVGYPAWLLLLARFRPRQVAPRRWQPHVTVCMAVHNGIAHLDAKIDGRVDARHGRFREAGLQDDTTPLGVPWSLQDDDTFAGGSNPDAQVAEVTALLRMDR